MDCSGNGRPVDLRSLIDHMKSSSKYTFYYLTPFGSGIGSAYSPYSFQLSEYKDVNKSFYITISSHGVVSYDHDIKEFQTLAEYERDYELFCLLSQNRTIKLYLLWKCFYKWRKQIRWRKICSARQEILGGAFIADESLYSLLSKIVVRCQDLGLTSLADVTCIENFELEEFIEIQKQKLSSNVEYMKTFQNEVIELLVDTCKIVLEKQEKDRKSNKRIVTPRTGASCMSYIEIINRTGLMEKLSRLIYQVALKVDDIYRRVVRNSFSDLYESLRIHSATLMTLHEGDVSLTRTSPQVPFFHIRLVADMNELVLEPAQHQFQTSISELMVLWIDALLSIPSIFSDTRLRPFICPEVYGKPRTLLENGPCLKFAIESDEVNQDLSNNILRVLNLNFVAVNEYLTEIRVIHDFYVENISLDINQIADETDPARLRVLLEKYHSQLAFLEATPDSHPIGFFLFHLSDFKVSVRPACSAVLHAVEKVIPTLASSKIKEMFKECNESMDYLEREPKSSVDLVVHLDFIEAQSERFNEIHKQLEYTEDIYQIVRTYSVPCPVKDFEVYENFKKVLDLVKTMWHQKIEDRGNIIIRLERQITKDVSNLNADIVDIHDGIKQDWLISRNANPEESMVNLHLLGDRLSACQKRSEEIRSYQKKFLSSVSRFQELENALADLRIRQLLLETLEIWTKGYKEFVYGDFGAIDPEKVLNLVSKSLKNVAHVEKFLGVNEITTDLNRNIKEFEQRIPVMTHLRNPSLKQRHWSRIEVLLCKRFTSGEPFNLDTLEACGVLKHIDELQELTAQASSEAALEGLLQKVEHAWKDLKLPVLNHRDSADVFVLGDLEEVKVVLDDSFVRVNTILTSKHVGPIKCRVQVWHESLDLFSSTLDEWRACQTDWIDLDAIFAMPDIQRQLPIEAHLFSQVATNWSDLMRRVKMNPLAMLVATAPGTLQVLQNNNRFIAQILKCLDTFFTSKRVAFPRFYFLSNQELLKLLADSRRHPLQVQTHLRKCFDGISKLEFAESESSNRNIVAMISEEGQKINFCKAVVARGNVEDWLGNLEIMMVNTLKEAIKEALVDYDSHTREDWLFAYPAQVVITVSHILFCEKVHGIFSSFCDRGIAMAALEKDVFKNLKKLAKLVRGEIAELERTVLCAIITLSIYTRDVVSSLLANKVLESDDFNWQKSLRYYWNHSLENCVVRMLTWCAAYGHEYLGVCSRLMITPHTERCLMNLVTALEMNLGGALSGPTASGKTETIKDFAKALAVPCLVFNCSENLDYKMTSSFLLGCASSGAWCCLDDIDRAKVEVLSVFAQQLLSLRNAKVAKLTRFMFDGRELKLNQRCATFVTLNPTYPGRCQLPDNFRASFRFSATPQADYGLIAEAFLFIHGFLSSKEVACKVTQIYRLCQDQLSQQIHYDFGLRSIKSVLEMAARLKMANLDVDEESILIRALKDNIEPKLLLKDYQLFQTVLVDVFPNVSLPSQDYSVFEKAIRAQLISEQLQPESCIIRKIIHFYETMIVRNGVMLLGQSGVGKTTVINILEKTLRRLFEDKISHPDYRPVQKYLVNPKAVTIAELFGEVNANLEWRDGILSLAVKSAAISKDNAHHWIICDGPVDTTWIENLNSALDDNKFLSLANSERVKLTRRTCFVFETDDLSNSSPAIISRCGFVCFDANELGWLPYVKSWLAYKMQVADEYKVYLLTLFECFLGECLEFAAKHCVMGMKQINLGKVATICGILQALLMPYASNLPNRKVISRSFLFALLWGIGGNLDEPGRECFGAFLTEKFRANHDTMLPERVNIWNVYVALPSAEFELWNTSTRDYIFNRDSLLRDVFVPTEDTIRISYLLKLFISIGRSILLAGSTGVGKSSIAQSTIKSVISEEDFVQVSMCCNAITSSMRTQQIVETRLQTMKKTLLSAPVGKRVLLFVEDVHMAADEAEKYQSPIEFFRQYLDYGGFYDRTNLYWKNVENMQLLSTCGDEVKLAPRFVRHFAVLTVAPPLESSLTVILTSILTGFLEDGTRTVKELTGNIVRCTVAFYQKIKIHLQPVPMKTHYLFNMHALRKCLQGLAQADPSSFKEPTSILRLYYHECLRCFQDHLCTTDDKKYLEESFNEACCEYFGLAMTDNMKSDNVLLLGNASRGGRIYEGTAEVRGLLEECLVAYNLTQDKKMDLVLFADAVQHCCRVAQILQSEQGHALLVGSSGAGKKSIAKLASHVNNYRIFEIQPTSMYNHQTFCQDLKKVFEQCGVENSSTTLLLEFNNFFREEVLEDISDILYSGEVPNLFSRADVEHIVDAVIKQTKDLAELPPKRIFETFLSKAKKCLHLTIVMTADANFRRHCRMFPLLLKYCVVDWFMPWPEDALTALAKFSLKKAVNDTLAARLYPLCVLIHKSPQQVSKRLQGTRGEDCVSPSVYLVFLRLFTKFLKEKNDELHGLRDRFSNGLQKLYETNVVVETMKAELVSYEPLLLKKSETTAELMKNLSKEQSAADQVRRIVLTDEAVAKAKAAETQILSDDTQRDLNEALPAMESAMKSLDSLNKNDINELKLFNKPPNLVKLVMDAICLLFGAKQDWASAKLLLGDVHFLKRLREFEKDNISEQMHKVMRVKFIDHPDFVPDKVATQSKVCRSLCMWVRAIDVYVRVYRIVEPKRRALDVAETELSGIMGVLREKQRKLAEVEGQIAGLESQLDAAMADKDAVETAMSLTAARLARSSRLTTALADEQSRWEHNVTVFTDRLRNLVGDMLLSAAGVAYFGPFTSDIRGSLIETWLVACSEHGILASTNFDIVQSLSNSYEVRSWVAAGLPQDSVSAENALLVTRCGNWPLIMDPHGHANRWIRKLESSNHLTIIRYGHANVPLTIIESAGKGAPLLIEDIGDDLSSIVPIQASRIVAKCSKNFIKLGSLEVELDPKFKLYLTTKMTELSCNPDVCRHLTIVKFSTTVSGLEEECLAQLVQLERPDVENARTDLITSINSDKLQLKTIEEKILQMLYGATGNILDDEELIDTLNEFRETTEMTATRLLESEAAETRLSKARDHYRPVASRAAVLFSTVFHLSSLNSMYQHSNSYLLQVLNGVVTLCEKTDDMEERVDQLKLDITLAIFKNVLRGLFTRHRLLFAFYLCTSISVHEGTLSSEMYNLFLQDHHVSGVFQDDTTALSILSRNNKKFDDLPANLHRLNLSIGDYTLTHPDIKTNSWCPDLNDFEKLLIVKILSPSNLVVAMTEYVKLALGPEFLENSSEVLHIIFQDVSNKIPLVFILSEGSDPYDSLLKMATERGCSEKFYQVSLGPGQEAFADKLINISASRGDWIYLQNCHLLPSWMPELERKWASLSDPHSDKLHADFRLFLSSRPFKAFPVGMLQCSLKISNQPPRGLRANLLRALNHLPKDFLQDSPLQNTWQRLVFGICFFQAYIQERVHFGRFGWNVPYNWTDSDRDIALTQLAAFSDHHQVAWPALQYILGEITYGGIVADSMDMRCLRSILFKFISPSALTLEYRMSSCGTYYCPEVNDSNSLHTYRCFVEELPHGKTFELFGLSEHANYASKVMVSSDLLVDLESIDRIAQLPQHCINDDKVLEIIRDIRTQLISAINVDSIHPHLLQKEEDGRMGPLTRVVMQEAGSYNELLALILTSVEDLRRSVRGERVLSPQSQHIYSSFLANQIPCCWRKASYFSNKNLINWIQDLTLRVDFIQRWLSNGAPPSFWLPGLFYPRAFLAAILQIEAKRLKMSQADFTFQTSVLDTTLTQQVQMDFGALETPLEGVLVHGLSLQAGHWDTHLKQLSYSSGSADQGLLPVIHLLPVQKYQQNNQWYECPVYLSNEVLLTVQLPCDGDSATWIILGTAIVCD